jgi:fatty-acyl-CoA synthase
MATTVLDALRWWSRQTPDAPALVIGDDSVTYGELEPWVARTANAILDAGAKPGDRIAVFGAPTIAWCVSTLAAMRIGAIALPVNPRLVETEVAALLTKFEPSVIIADPTTRDRVEGARAENPAVHHVDVSSIVGLRAIEAPAHLFEVLDASQPALIINTSGTTGESKGVVFSHAAVVSPVAEWTMLEPQAFRPGVRTLLVLPLTFHAGMVTGLCMTLTMGGLLVIEPKLNGDNAVAAIEKYRIETLFGPPIVFETLADASGFEAADLSSVKSAWIGGARVPVELLHRWLAKGVALRQIYGLTEAGGCITATPVADAADHPDSCGPGGFFTVIRTIRPDGTDTDPGEAGEIVIKGPSMLSGYWNDSEATARAVRDGWLHTGDLGVFEDGRLKMVERLKELIISGGINISPMEVETTIAAIEGVEDVVVIPVEDARFGETPAAIVYGTEVSVDQIVAHCGHNLADYKVPRYVVLVDGPLPRLPAGKISRADVKRDYADIPTRFPRVR